LAVPFPESSGLRRFECGHRWVNDGGSYTISSELLSDGAPPEMLFFERCIDWLAPGGRLGIVLPKSFLDTQTYRAARTILFRDCRLLAVINCHKNTFQPHTGVRTCLIVLEKKRKQNERLGNYSIFMAISRRIGQDSEGVPIYKRDPQNNLLDEFDHDLDEICELFKQFRNSRLVSSGYCFSIARSDIDDHLRINPQMFLPHLNETLENVEKIDGCEGWSVSALSQLETDMKIFKGPRFKSENMIVEEETERTEHYFTPSAILQEKSDSVKILDMSRATEKQLATISAIRVLRGDIVITRSGSIGRVAYITQRHHNAIVSDDLIRVRIRDSDLRYYMFHYLQTRYAQDQMQRNEYGAIQQHLEPEHIRNLLVVVSRIFRTFRHATAPAVEACSA
jgi:type I restriction enzyme M protein